MSDRISEEELAKYKASLAKFNPKEFGSFLPDDEFTRQFSLGPWHELRRQMTLFFDFVAPKNLDELHQVVKPSDEIEHRCDMWIAEFLLTKNRKGIVPPDDLRKWLGVRAQMALVFLNRQIEVRGNDKSYPPPDMKKFEDEVGMRLTSDWYSAFKDFWLENDPNQSSTAE